MKYSWLLMSVMASALLLNLQSSMAQQPIIIKFSHAALPDTAKGKAAIRFKELAEARTNGKVKVEVYPNNELFKEKEELEALQIGVVQMLAPTLTKFGPLGATAFEVFDLPYLFPGEEAFVRFTQSEVGQDLFKTLENKNMKGLAYWSGGFHVFSANRPLRTPDDMKGLVMRLSPTKVLETTYRQLGAIPKLVAFADVYQALKSGFIDGTENILSNYASQKYYNVQQHLTLTYHSHLGYAVIVNKSFWDDLPKDIQVSLTAAMKDATDYEIKQCIQENEEALKIIKSSGKTQVLALTDAERALWIKALQPVYKKMELRIGHDLIQTVVRESATKGLQ